MKRAYQAVGWELTAAGALAGLSLGFDRRAEHIQGISPLLARMGVQVAQHPIGVHERKIIAGHPELRHSVYEASPGLNRRRFPAALLVLAGAEVRRGGGSDADDEELVHRFDLGFVQAPTHRLNVPANDLVTAWGADGFAVHARGEPNMALLEQLYQSMIARDLSVLAPQQPGGVPGPVRLLRISQLSPADQSQLAELDLEHRELSLAVFETGILAQLAKAGCQYHALSPAWFDEFKDEVVFYLEPSQPNTFNTGWFSLAELRDWAAGRGTVVRDRRLERLALYAQPGDWQSRLIHGLASMGAKPRYGMQLVWLDKYQLIAGVRYRATRETAHILPSGTYALSALAAHQGHRSAAPERRHGLSSLPN